MAENNDHFDLAILKGQYCRAIGQVHHESKKSTLAMPAQNQQNHNNFLEKLSIYCDADSENAEKYENRDKLHGRIFFHCLLFFQIDADANDRHHTHCSIEKDGLTKEPARSIHSTSVVNTRRTKSK